ncbi:MAG: hypothetical protein RR235_08395 [Oscillospiraceae bacterium]
MVVPQAALSPTEASPHLQQNSNIITGMEQIWGGVLFVVSVSGQKEAPEYLTQFLVQYAE